jgi:hypothetical protein
MAYVTPPIDMYSSGACSNSSTCGSY